MVIEQPTEFTLGHIVSCVLFDSDTINEEKIVIWEQNRYNMSTGWKYIISPWYIANGKLYKYTKTGVFVYYVSNSNTLPNPY